MADPDILIRVEHLSKRYLIGHQAAGRAEESFREMLVRETRNLSQSLLATARGRQILQADEVEEFWALRDISFEVRRGEVLGVIGRNGAGKSTLLKVLSRITEPSSGRATIRGRVASLLEVGTGFHPELTGRENIYLNGAILGMSRAEIRRKFDEIVAFAEVERFLDTPVKRYSSGMHVRLAFAVAAHLEPEILLIDEVLAVGDVAFQRKCLGKMRDVAEHGRTVLFVSHNLPAIIDLTERALLLEAGRLRANGPSREVVSLLLQMTHEQAQTTEDVSTYRRAHRAEGYVNINSVKVCGTAFGTPSLDMGSPLLIEIGITVEREVEGGLLVMNILNDQLEPITTVTSSDNGYFFRFAPGRYTIRCELENVPLIPGHYRLNIGTTQKGGGLSWDVLEALPGFQIEGYRNRAWMNWPNRPGVVLFDRCKWSDGQETPAAAQTAELVDVKPC